MMGIDWLPTIMEYKQRRLLHLKIHDQSCRDVLNQKLQNVKIR